MSCSSGCPTQDHPSWGACLRAKKLHVADVTAHKVNGAIHRSQKEYVKAREAGLQPDGSSAAQVASAWKQTDATGVAYRADV
jgi:hypothetical protein